MKVYRYALEWNRGDKREEVFDLSVEETIMKIKELLKQNAEYVSDSDTISDNKYIWNEGISIRYWSSKYV